MDLPTASPIIARSAIERIAAGESLPGALDGFESTCSCGLVMRSSLLIILEQDRREHGAWHARRREHAAKRERLREPKPRHRGPCNGTCIADGLSRDDY